MGSLVHHTASNEAEGEQMEKACVAGLGTSCPLCGEHLRRVKRKGWTASIPFSKAYSCSKCRTRFLRIFDYCQFKLNRAAGMDKSKKELAVVTSAIIMTVYVCYRIVIYLYEAGVQQQ
jgi:ssDNA-binding Zn-finger/Zn-ribbon topoisomerase 1